MSLLLTPSEATNLRGRCRWRGGRAGGTLRTRAAWVTYPLTAEAARPLRRLASASYQYSRRAPSPSGSTRLHLCGQTTRDAAQLPATACVVRHQLVGRGESQHTQVRPDQEWARTMPVAALQHIAAVALENARVAVALDHVGVTAVHANTQVAGGLENTSAAAVPANTQVGGVPENAWVVAARESASAAAALANTRAVAPHDQTGANPDRHRWVERHKKAYAGPNSTLAHTRMNCSTARGETRHRTPEMQGTRKLHETAGDPREAEVYASSARAADGHARPPGKMKSRYEVVARVTAARAANNPTDLGQARVEAHLAANESEAPK